MTAQLPIEPLPVKKSPLRYVKWGAGLLLGAVAAFLLWQWANDMSGIRREAPKVPTIIPLPPPPPPPPKNGVRVLSWVQPLCLDLKILII